MSDQDRPDETAPEGVLASHNNAQDPENRTRAKRTSVRRPQQPPKGRPRGWAILIVLVVIVGPGIFWFMNQGAEEDLPVDFGDEGPIEAAAVAGDRAVVLVFPEWDAGGYVTEERQIPSRDRPGEDLFALMHALCEGPEISGSISAMPRGTRALAAFVNPDDNSVVVDFSQELVTGHPGGSTAEVATLTSILRTVALNFPGTRSCVILVEGAQVETLAGHLDLLRSFDPRRWL